MTRARVAVMLSCLLALGVVLASTGCRVLGDDIVCAGDRDCPRDRVCERGVCAKGDDDDDDDDTGEGEGEGGGEGEGEGEPIACIDNGDCPVDAACIDGVCVRRCNDDDDCPAEAYCDATSFFGGDLVCFVGCRFTETDDSCPTGQVCSAGTRECVAERGSPGGTFDLCANGRECLSESCHIFVGEDHGYCTQSCADNFDCAFGVECVFNECVERCDEGPCSDTGCCPISGLPDCFAGSCTVGGT